MYGSFTFTSASEPVKARMFLYFAAQLLRWSLRPATPRRYVRKSRTCCLVAVSSDSSFQTSECRIGEDCSSLFVTLTRVLWGLQPQWELAFDQSSITLPAQVDSPLEGSIWAVGAPLVAGSTHVIDACGHAPHREKPREFLEVTA